MKTPVKPKITGAGRIFRALIAAALLSAALLASALPRLARLAIAAAGVFVMFEALRGWCVLRACGVKTRF